MDKFCIPKPFDRKGLSVWEEYTILEDKYNPVNLGPGFPNFIPDQFALDALAEVARSKEVSDQQSTREEGHPRLVNAVAKCYSQVFYREIDPMTEVIVTGGAYDSLYCSIFGHVDIGDEVILVEPFFDCYSSMALSAGAVLRYIPLREKEDSSTSERSSKNFYLDEEELAGLFNEKTKIIIINNPHNPTGKMFSKDELTVIADLCKKWNVLCISDEVYEWFVYDNNEHIRIATLPGMWERTLSIYSAGKTFGITGWKIGWTIGHAKLIANLRYPKNTMRPTPTQVAVAIMLEQEMKDFKASHIKKVPIKMQHKRDMLIKILADAGMKPIVPQGGYFTLVDWTFLKKHIDLSEENDDFEDQKFTKWLIKNGKLMGIPTTVFYGPEHGQLGEKYIRFCFVKTEEMISEAGRCLKESMTVKT